VVAVQFCSGGIGCTSPVAVSGQVAQGVRPVFVTVNSISTPVEQAAYTIAALAGDTNRRTISFGAVGMYREHLRSLFGALKRVLRTDQRLTISEFYELLQLAEAIIYYAEMIQNHEMWSGPTPPYILVELPEMARRFRETPRAINGALLLLKNMGRATPVKSRIWRVKLPGAPRRRQDAEVA
jgi:hypothetical protein